MFKAKKFLAGKKAKEIKKDNNSIQITNDMGETREFQKDVGIYFENPVFDNKIVNIINVAIDEKTSGFSLSTEGDEVHIHANEYDDMRSSIVSEPTMRTREHTIREERLIIKKPDLLGKSQWGFKFREISIEASIEDLVWLQSFQSRHTPVMSGSSLIVDLRVETVIDENDEDMLGINPKYTVIKVYGDIRNPPEQLKFNDPN